MLIRYPLNWCLKNSKASLILSIFRSKWFRIWNLIYDASIISSHSFNNRDQILITSYVRRANRFEFMILKIRIVSFIWMSMCSNIEIHSFFNEEIEKRVKLLVSLKALFILSAANKRIVRNRYNKSITLSTICYLMW